MIKTLLYTGVRVSELVSIRLTDVDLDSCRIRIEQGKGKKDRYVPFPASFKETLALHTGAQKQAGASHLFESSWKKPYSDRGVRKILARYASAAGIEGPISPHRLRHFLFTWLKTQGIDDALIQPYSGHATRQSLEIYSRIALANAQDAYDQAIGRYPRLTRGRSFAAGDTFATNTPSTGRSFAPSATGSPVRSAARPSSATWMRT
jgi:integrase/recombinase XerD